MIITKADIIAGLRRDILPLQGFKMISGNLDLDTSLGPIKNAFPNHTFPLAAVHEFICTSHEEVAVTHGFINGLLGSLMQKGGVCMWIGNSQNIFPPALKSFGIDPDKIIFIEMQKEKEILWTIEEALKCEGLSAVIGEVKEIDFTASRRLQLAVEQSHVTGFIVRRSPRNLNTTACLTRWKICSQPSELEDNMPGVGFPRWQVELQKVRNGKPGTWHIEFIDGRFRHVYKTAFIPALQKKQTG